MDKAQSTFFYVIKTAHSSCIHLKQWCGAESGRRTKSLPWFRGGESREDISFLVEAFIRFAVIGLMTESSTINMICNALGAWSWSLFPSGLNWCRQSISAQGGNHQRVGFTEADGHLSFVSWRLYYFTQLSQDIKVESKPQLGQVIYINAVHNRWVAHKTILAELIYYQAEHVLKKSYSKYNVYFCFLSNYWWLIMYSLWINGIALALVPAESVMTPGYHTEMQKTCYEMFLVSKLLSDHDWIWRRALRSGTLSVYVCVCETDDGSCPSDPTAVNHATCAF